MIIITLHEKNKTLDRPFKSKRDKIEVSDKVYFTQCRLPSSTGGLSLKIKTRYKGKGMY